MEHGAVRIDQGPVDVAGARGTSVSPDDHPVRAVEGDRRLGAGTGSAADGDAARIEDRAVGLHADAVDFRGGASTDGAIVRPDDEEMPISIRDGWLGLIISRRNQHRLVHAHLGPDHRIENGGKSAPIDDCRRHPQRERAIGIVDRHIGFLTTGIDPRRAPITETEALLLVGKVMPVLRLADVVLPGHANRNREIASSFGTLSEKPALLDALFRIFELLDDLAAHDPQLAFGEGSGRRQPLAET